MEHSKYFERLAAEIVKLSVTKEWATARGEWTLVGINIVDDGTESCLCGHRPIVELCELRNISNNQTATVGNVCVSKFFDIKSAAMFQSIRRVTEWRDAALSLDVIAFAFARGWINEWEFTFYSDTMRKRKPSEAQWRKRVDINEKILRRVYKGVVPEAEGYL